MVVYHTDCLHMCIYDGRSDKGKTSFLEVLTEGLGFFGHCRKLVYMLPPIDDWLISDKLPNIGVETPKFLLHLQKSFSVMDGGIYFEFIANNFRGLDQPIEILIRILGDHFGIKVRKGLLIPLPSFQNDCPTKPGLCAFQHQKFEMRPVVMHRHTPFNVMVWMELRILCPLASFFHIVIIVILEREYRDGEAKI